MCSANPLTSPERHGMANQEHLEILKQGVEAWNKWRHENGRVEADFRNANLRGTYLGGASFYDTNFRNADLRGAYLGGANLNYISFKGACLDGADLSRAYLTEADLYKTELANANFFGVHMVDTRITDVDLSEVKNLESVEHWGRSTIGIDTIYKSRGNIPEKFLRGCGVPESFIAQIPALVAAIEPIQFYSCFISYSSKDEEFAKRLYADLQNEGVRCWFAPEDLKIGEKFRVRIDESIRLHDKLLLVLSESSVASQWVEKEVETALEKEREQGKIVLFPLRLDDAVLEIKTGWAADVRRSRHIGDFTDWKN